MKPIFIVGGIAVLGAVAAIALSAKGYFGETTEIPTMDGGAVGSIAAVSTRGDICTDEQTCTLSSMGEGIFPGNRLKTDSTGRMKTDMIDGTFLIIGSDAEVVVEEYAYEPKTLTTFVTYLTSGSLRLVSGKTKTPERDIRVETPVASTAARGTDYWVGEIDGNFAVLLLDGEVVVSTDVGEVVLDEPGEGVTLTSRSDAPGEVKVWPEAKAQRALAMVEIN